MSVSAFLGRQPVLNRNQQLIGYELLFRESETSTEIGRHAELDADTEVLVNTLNHMGTSWLIGNKLAFINVGESMIGSDFLELLPPRRVVLEISGKLTPSNELLSRVRHLRSLGFGVALDGFSFESPAAAFLDLANYVKLDVQSMDAQTFQTLAVRLRSYPVIRIAERVETYEHYHLARDLGLDGYQGYYFAKPETLSAKVIHPSFANTLKLLNLLRQDAALKEVEAVLKTDVALSFKLLRYVNSAAAGLNTTISSFSHALTVLGYKRLYRWLTLLLVTSSENGLMPAALQKTAVSRARMMELIALESGLPSDVADSFFITGMFSLLDVIFDMPIALALEHLNLPEEICEALMVHAGRYGLCLELVLAMEAGTDNLPQLAQRLNIEAEALNLLHTSALSWVEELSL